MVIGANFKFFERREEALAQGGTSELFHDSLRLGNILIYGFQGSVVEQPFHPSAQGLVQAKS